MHNISCILYGMFGVMTSLCSQQGDALSLTDTMLAITWLMLKQYLYLYFSFAMALVCKKKYKMLKTKCKCFMPTHCQFDWWAITSSKKLTFSLLRPPNNILWFLLYHPACLSIQCDLSTMLGNADFFTLSEDKPREKVKPWFFCVHVNTMKCSTEMIEIRVFKMHIMTKFPCWSSWYWASNWKKGLMISFLPRKSFLDFWSRRLSVKAFV